MSRKHTIEFIREQFEKEGYILVSTEYVNCMEKLDCICPKKHEYSVTWNVFQQGHRCAKCANCEKLTIDFVRASFEKEGYILTSTEYVNSNTKLDYICPKKHIGSIKWNDWKTGYRCAKCFFENNIGENNSRWNPNLTDEDRQDRRLIPEYKEWRTAVFKQANYTCEICGQVGGNLNAHHKNSYSSCPEQRTLLKNGACVCERCHKNFHHQYGRGNNTEEQFLEFKEKYIGSRNKNR